MLKDHPAAVVPYLVTRDHLIQRVHRQRTGYWHPEGDGVEHFTSAELAAAADLLGGGTAAAFTRQAASSPGAASMRSRCGSSTWACSATRARPISPTSDTSVLQRLLHRHQVLNPFVRLLRGPRRPSWRLAG